MIRSLRTVWAVPCALLVACQGELVGPGSLRPDSGPSFATSGSTVATVTDLGTLGGPTSGGSGINDLGWVTGTSYGRAYVWKEVWADGAPNLMRALPLPDAFVSGGTEAYRLNNSGVVVGAHYYSGHNVPLVWRPTTRGDYVEAPTVLQGLGGPYTYTKDVNASDQIVGSSDLAPYVTHAVFWASADPSVPPTDLHALLPDAKSYDYSRATGINGSGVAVGTARLPRSVTSRKGTTIVYEFDAFVWTPCADPTVCQFIVTKLGRLAGYDRMFAEAIDDKGLTVVGYAESSSDKPPRAVRWVFDAVLCNGWCTAQELVPGGPPARARHINEAGQIIGSAFGTRSKPYAYVWDAVNGLRQLPYTDTSYETGASCINEPVAGRPAQIAGTRQKGDYISGETRALRWQLLQ